MRVKGKLLFFLTFHDVDITLYLIYPIAVNIERRFTGLLRWRFHYKDREFAFLPFHYFWRLALDFQMSRLERRIMVLLELDLRCLIADGRGVKSEHLTTFDRVWCFYDFS